MHASVLADCGVHGKANMNKNVASVSPFFQEVFQASHGASNDVHAQKQAYRISDFEDLRPLVAETHVLREVLFISCARVHRRGPSFRTLVLQGLQRFGPL